MSGTLETQLAASRAARDLAKFDFDARLAQVKTDLEARGIGGRIADRVVADATDLAFEAVDIADENRGIVAGTIVAVGLWVFREPIFAWFRD